MKTTKMKTGTQVRGILVLAAITALSATTMLTGCGQRARLRLPAPATENPMGKKADAPGKVDEKPASPGVDGLNKGTAPGAGIAPVPAEPATVPAAGPVDKGVRLYGETGAAQLANLEAGRIGAIKALTDAQLAVQEGQIRLSSASAQLVGMAQTRAFINMDEAPLKSYCYLFRGDSRASLPSGENEICDKVKNPVLTVEMVKDFDTTEIESRPCVDMRVVARFYDTAWKASEALLNDQLANNEDFKKLDQAMSNLDTIDNAELAGDRKVAFDFYNAVNDGHKYNTEAAKAIVAIAEAAKCSFK